MAESGDFNPTTENRTWHAAATRENAEKIAKKLGWSQFKIVKILTDWGLPFVVIKED